MHAATPPAAPTSPASNSEPAVTGASHRTQADPGQAPAYAELHCLSNFTFLRGASHPGELVQTAQERGYQAIAITDECSVAGVVRALVAADASGIKLIVGSEFRTVEGLHLVLLARDRTGYGQLCALISKARRRAPKGEYTLHDDDLRNAIDHCLGIWLPLADPDALPAQVWQHYELLRAALPDACWLGVNFCCDGHDAQRQRLASDWQQQTGMPIVACGDVHMHVPARLPLQQVLTAIRHKCSVSQLGRQRLINAEKHLHTRETLARRYPAAWLQESLHIAARCQFSLRELRYEYPREVVPEGVTPDQHLRTLVYAGARKRWPQGLRSDIAAIIEKELALVRRKEYESYFLTVHDIVRYARSRDIWCQGRGSAANSVICFCLFITEVDPAQTEVLFERFLSDERDEPPDIDVDFEHARREDVIQYIYNKYTRKRTAMTATVISYRLRSAIRDVGKALGLETSLLDTLADNTAWWDSSREFTAIMQRAGLDPDSRIMCLFRQLVLEIRDFPRHLSQHVGGFIISRGLLSELVPVENASMADRTVVQWNKDDIEYLKLLKVDVLALGILTAMHKCRDLIATFHGIHYQQQDFNQHDDGVYHMLQQGDAIGVFQVESRAQLSMLPRLKPRCFYDLVIEVAIVRPGPIQGGMVHPYLQRRENPAAVEYPSEALRPVLARTLGIPIFQEQVLKLAMVAANFSGGEADQLRRAMGAWQRKGGLEKHEAKLVAGMRKNGYDELFISQICQQIRGFGEYGFPESHAASFALLAYNTAWLKYHYPAAYCAALINSQPMGFYSPSQLIQDVQRHSVSVRPVDVCHSEWPCTLEADAGGAAAIRLGLQQVKGLSENIAHALIAARQAFVQEQHAYTWEQLARRAGLDRQQAQLLSRAGALRTLSGDRHQAHWQTLAIEAADALGNEINETATTLPATSEAQNILHDYRYLGLSLERHPLALLRRHPALKGCVTAGELPALPDKTYVALTGLVTNRQRPGTASGVLFMTLEDETGNANLVVWTRTQERFRTEILTGQLLRIEGHVENQNNVTHVIVYHLRDLGALAGELRAQSRDFH